MPLRPITLFGISLSMVTGVVIGITSFWALERHYPDPSAEATARTLVAVVQQVSDSYVRTVPQSELVDNAIRGMMDALDAHSTFLDKQDFDRLQEETTGRFGGIGIEIGLTAGKVTVIAPLDNTPAERAGMQAGDTLVELDHGKLAHESLTQAVNNLRGEPGSQVHVRVQRAGHADPIDFNLVRAIISVNSVRSRLLEPGIGYLRISQFQNTTGDDVKRAIEDLASQSESRLAGLIIDLRNNPGGVLRASVAVADTFLDHGLIVYTEGRLPSSDIRFTASGTDILDGAPIAVLINRGSASASEIVAGALQDHGRAVLVGTKSYGKGSVQSVLPLENQRAIKLTTALYFTPSGRSIQSNGITPDVTVPNDGVATPEAYSEMLLAEALKHLKQG